MAALSCSEFAAELLNKESRELKKAPRPECLFLGSALYYTPSLTELRRKRQIVELVKVIPVREGDGAAFIQTALSASFL